MTLTAVILLMIGLVMGVVVAWFLTHRKADDTTSLLLRQELDLLRQSLEGNTRALNEQLAQINREMTNQLQQSFKTVTEVNRHVGDRLDNAAKVVGEVQNRLGKMEEASSRIFEVGKDIASLQEILRAPKLRGSLGETFLGDLLAQVLPKSRFELQYSFKSGEKVDAVIRSVHGLIPVDSKFPLENFARLLEAKTDEERKPLKRVFVQDVRRHIDSIAAKYILPGEGTLELALMYIPAENVYYEIMVKSDGLEKDLLGYANERHVYPVSPNSFYAYLQTIAIGLRGMQIAEGVKEVINHLAAVKGDFAKFGVEFEKIGTHLSHARGSFEAADKQRTRLGDKLEDLALGESPLGESSLEEGERGSLRMLKEAGE